MAVIISSAHCIYQSGTASLRLLVLGFSVSFVGQDQCITKANLLSC